MRKVILYSLLLVAGLVGSQLLDGWGAQWISLMTMFALSFIMIQVGLEFDMDKSRPGQYLWDYVVAGTAAAFPWIFCALYFVFVMAPPELWGHADLWKETLLQSRFASPTSAGVLFSMLAAAGLGATWMFKKARILAIFDDLDTILLMIPLKILIVGLKWQLAVLVLVILAMLFLAWRYLNRLRLPITWPYVMLYALVITGISEGVYLASARLDDSVPVHLEVLLPAFVWGCILAPPARHGDAGICAQERHILHAKLHGETIVATAVSALFMLLVGLSMPPLQGAGASATLEKEPILEYQGVAPEVLAEKNRFPGWGMVGVHVLAVTLLSNLGKIFPALCYRKEAPWRHRLAVAVGMFPRGEVGAGVLVVSLSYGISGPAVTVAALSLALNLLATGLFILIARRLTSTAAAPTSPG